MTGGIAGAAGSPLDAGSGFGAAGYVERSVELRRDLARDAARQKSLEDAKGFAEALRREMERGGGARGGAGSSGAAGASSSTDRRLLDACYELESMFIEHMLRSMRRTVDESDFFGKSLAKDIFRDMLYGEYAKTMARTDQLGIARLIYNQFRVP